MASKIFSITTRDANGQDKTVRLSADRAERNGAQVDLFSGENLVGSFISVTNLVDESAFPEAPASQPQPAGE